MSAGKVGRGNYDALKREEFLGGPGRDVTPNDEDFRSWVSNKKCLLAADGRCRGPVIALELDFPSSPNAASRDVRLIPICEAHDAQRNLKGWDTLITDAGLSRADVVNAAGLLRGRWNRSSADQRAPITRSDQ
jgi:hypothetical protein